MKKLSISKEEAEQLFDDDRAVDKMKDKDVNNDLDADKQKVVKKMKQADRKPTTYRFAKKAHKPNATKGTIIAALVTFLNETDTFSVENLEIVNNERQLRFQSAGNTFDLTLIQKRKPKT